MRSTWILSGAILLIQALYFPTVAADETHPAQLKTELQQVQKLESAGKTRAAVKAYQSLLKRYPQQVEIYNNLAVLMAKQGKLDSAREYLEQAMHANQVYATVYDNLTAVYVEMARGSYANALQLGVTPQQISLKKVKLETQLARQTTAASSSQPPATVTAEVAPAQPATKINSTGELDQDILLTLQGWASAWSAQEVDLYLSFYDAEFKPAKGMSRSRWEQQRSQRLRRPAWVKITLNDFKREPAEEGFARVRFMQYYQSDHYRDKTRKELLLKSSDEGWRILSERSL